MWRSGKVFQAGLESRPGCHCSRGACCVVKGHPNATLLSWWLSKVEARKGDEEGAFEQGLVKAGADPGQYFRLRCLYNT